MKRPLVSIAKPRLLWCIMVAVMAKKVKMKRMKVCPSEIRYLSAQTGEWIYFSFFIKKKKKMNGGQRLT